MTPGSEAPSRRWPQERLVEFVGLALRKSSHAVVLAGSDADAETARAVTRTVRSPRVLDLTGRTSLLELAALAAQARGVLANDTGGAHLAAAMGAPTVVLFGAGDPARTAPRGAWVRVLNNDVWCSPCIRNVCPYHLECLWSITARQAWDALVDLLATRAQEASVVREPL